ncbi:putative poly-beta-1,6-N-acetyl-D-glucosamine export protein [Phocicoccus schoeneichii]|uniref:polysaccharide intercellular adhesin biosynthesis/export protein IcaC n=3 Tax=Phocicoccus schoeneichii TaxID=1812261 RepID=UPI00166488E5|nr:polysaccharide intercellular adhesin biosynthesis/export protein IcaC [Jeotgalicoccus schoeneichii]GGH52026.1 putative poly-beta-1,6-N-acetyl-D-glucosamine export protein [Jeotgalicoccus schoeneichii]
MSKQKKPELIYLRTFICIAIVLIHLITTYTNDLQDSDVDQLKLTFFIQNLLIFATPSFIILSQLLTTLNYKEINFNYLITRFKYILVPYLIMGIFYSFGETMKGYGSFTEQFYENIILGYWYGYFIIVILKFYVMSYIIYKVNYNIFNSKIILGVAFIIQITFLSLLHNNDSFADFFYSVYPLNESTFILGWIFFFFLGGYIGKNYDKITRFLSEYLMIIIFLAIVSFISFSFFFTHDYWMVTSFDGRLIFYHTFMFLLMLGICLNFNTLMFDSIHLISNFSLFIYLLHPIFLREIYNFTSLFIEYTIPFIILSLLFIIGTCVGVGMLLREFYIFRFIIGKQPYKLRLFS